jgi:pimeloyl-ACP methyl ester carboxylesterase
MVTGVMTYEENKIHVLRLGKGKQLLFAFHDIEDDASYFESLENTLGGQYSIIAIDLPGLGKSEWKGIKMNKVALITAVERFKLEFDVEKFSILAIGLGALYALSTLEQRSEWVEKVMLWSPMGLRRSSWQQKATVTWWSKNKLQQIKANEVTAKTKSLVSWGILKKDWLPEFTSFAADENLSQLWQQVFPLTYPLVPEIQKVRWQVKKHGLQMAIYCSDTALTMKKDAVKFAKRQDKVSLHFESPQQIYDRNYILQRSVEFFKQEA